MLRLNIFHVHSSTTRRRHRCLKNWFAFLKVIELISIFLRFILRLKWRYPFFVRFFNRWIKWWISSLFIGCHHVHDHCINFQKLEERIWKVNVVFVSSSGRFTVTDSVLLKIVHRQSSSKCNMWLIFKCKSYMDNSKIDIKIIHGH